ncbi:MAG: hydrogenase maturation nickel metallochaperone HypA [Candidatus Bathyarchaeota archaeon]|nr:MAG: hydrogenase maturation nickel metallochaperone HypA [Candidatus Bathyarchaeota archaeon]
MHEGAITRQIVDSVLKEASNRKAKKVIEVDLLIGSLTFLNPEQVKFWYEILTKDTFIEGSKLSIRGSEAVVRCTKCNYEGSFKYVDDPALHVSMPTMQCPKCEGMVEIVSGKDCIIKSIRMSI